MRFVTRIRGRFLAAAVLAVIILLSGVPRFVFAADAPAASIPVLIASHAEYTRIVFTFPKLVAYHVNTSDGKVRIDFDTTAEAVLGANKSPLISSITVGQSGGVLKADIGLVRGATVKSYRLQRKIVLDIYPSGAMPKPAAKPKAAAPSAVEKPIVKTEEVAAPPAAETAKAVTPPPAAEKEKSSDITKPAVLSAAPATPAPTPAQESAPPAVAAPAEKVEVVDPHSQDAVVPPLAAIVNTGNDDVPADDKANPTKITLSFLAPTRLAVFERSKALWIVTDSTASTVLPVIAGPMASFITPTKALRFDKGTAYSYTLPKKFYPIIKKSNLSWEILLSSVPAAPASPDDTKVTFDQTGRKAKWSAALKGAAVPIPFEDPTVGDMLYIVPTNMPGEAVRNMHRFSDMEVIPAALGMVIRPLKDKILVTPVNDTVLLTSPEGLAIAPESGGTAVLIGEAEGTPESDTARLFDFPNWQQGGISRFQENKQKIQDDLVTAVTPEDRAGMLMRLAMLYFSNHFGQEALGILEIVQSENPEIEKNPDFIALRGAANAMSGHFKEAFQDMSYPPIQMHPEVNLWIGFAAAATEQWHMADRSFPKSNRLLLQYPDNIAIPFTVYMAESALHLGRTEVAEQLLDTINLTSEAMDPQYKAAVAYLRGQTFAQQGDLDKAAELWEPVAKGLDRLYHTKATLSLTRVLLQQKKISLKEAIDRIDSLRFAWRGDGLEVEVLRTLGTLKVQDNQVLSGLEDMKQATDLSEGGLDDSEHIKDEMKRIFRELFVGGQADKIPPLEAVAVYNAFNTLLPPGAEGVTATLDFANYLIRMDLLDKAAALIEEQLKTGLAPEKTVSVGTKLAAVYLLNRQPAEALAALQKTEVGSMSEAVIEERTLLKARAQSQLKQTTDAIATLSTLTSKNARRLKADVLWRGEDWNGAGAAIENLLSDSGSATALSEEDAQLVVNAAVAWKLAGNTDKLKDIREKYGAAMAATKQASTFGVVTRDGGASALADRDSMLKISGEVDMFRGFLDSYKAEVGKGS